MGDCGVSTLGYLDDWFLTREDAEKKIEEMKKMMGGKKEFDENKKSCFNYWSYTGSPFILYKFELQISHNY